MRPSESDYAPYYGQYVALVPEDDVLQAIEQQSSQTQKVLAGLDEARAAFRYEESKWSIKQVIGHVADSERVFGYRALAIARGDTEPLPGFDQNDWMARAGFDDWKIGDLAEAYALVRRMNIVSFRNLAEEAWDRRGVANDAEVTVRALAYMIVGHERHHLNILRDRYHVAM